MERKTKQRNQIIKVANNIAIGGMIALGKSTLTRKLSESLKAQPVSEIDERDDLTRLLLEKMYLRDGTNTYGPLFQIYFLLTRYNKYKQEANNKKLSIFDRTIFEDWLFAKININDADIFNYYSKMGEARVRDLLYKTGIPKLYVILSGDGDLFIERLKKRNRKYEIDNLNKNMEYFKTLLNGYVDYLVNTCRNYGINYVIINADQDIKESVKQVKKALRRCKGTR